MPGRPYWGWSRFDPGPRVCRQALRLSACGVSVKTLRLLGSGREQPPQDRERFFGQSFRGPSEGVSAETYSRLAPRRRVSLDARYG
jgi:hypothetical protein